MSRTRAGAGDPVAARLVSLRGGAPPRPITAGVVAGQAANTRCGLLTVANAAGVSLDHVLTGTPWEVPFGQASSALARGHVFERMVKEHGYAILLALLREELGFDVTAARVEDLRSRFPLDPTDPYRTFRMRAAETRTLIGAFLARDPAAPNLIDGAVLTVSLGGQVGFLEADAVALRFDGPIRIGEIKSFPVVDGRADPDKVGAAADQAAVYVLALQDLVAELGGDPEVDVSTEVLLIAAKNTGMKPVLHRIQVARRIAHHRRELAGAPDLAELVAALPVEVSFPTADSLDPATDLAGLAEATGTHYMPDCLSFCGAARWCRQRARDAGDPARLGTGAVRSLPGVRTLGRVVELAAGAPPTAEEAPTAVQLTRAARLADAASPPPASGPRRRGIA
jgi:hypothetical protein